MPLLHAGIALGDWIRGHPDATAKQRENVVRTQALLRAVPAVPIDVDEASYWVTLEHYNGAGVIAGERWAWGVHIDRTGLGISHFFTDEGTRARGEVDEIAEFSREVLWGIGHEPYDVCEAKVADFVGHIARIGEAAQAPGARISFDSPYRERRVRIVASRAARDTIRWAAGYLTTSARGGGPGAVGGCAGDRYPSVLGLAATAYRFRARPQGAANPRRKKLIAMQKSPTFRR